MSSRVTGGASLVITLLGLAILWRAAASPDSDVWNGLIAATPLLILGAALAVLSRLTRRRPSGGE